MGEMIKIACISDTHLMTNFAVVPDADILIHAGDALNRGELGDLVRFKLQLKPHANRFKHILFVPGNHDRCFEYSWDIARQSLEEIPNVTVLHDKEIELYGLKFFGTAWQPHFFDWAFNVRGHEELAYKYKAIPDDVNILITHCPPFGILDKVQDTSKCGRRAGSPELMDRIKQLNKLKLHVFGHIHGSHGVECHSGVNYINAASCDEDYDAVNAPIVIDFPAPSKDST